MEDLDLVKKALESMNSALRVSTQIYADILATQKGIQNELKVLEARVKKLETNG